MANGNGNGNGKYSVEEIIAAIQKARGNLSHAARIVGCARTTLHRYVNKYSTVADAYENENEKTIDHVEDQLLRQIDDGNITAIIFFLKTKAKHRGYIERAEVTGKDGADLITLKWPEDQNG